MNKIYKVVNGKVVSELAKSISKAVVISSFLLSGSMAIASDDLVNNFTDSDFLTWIQQDENAEKIEYIKTHFAPNEYSKDENTNQYLGKPKGFEFGNLSDLERASSIPTVSTLSWVGDSISFYYDYLDLEANGKTIEVNMTKGVTNYQIESESEYNQFKEKLKEKQNEVNEAIYKIDDLFYTDSLKDRTVELTNKKYKIAELQLEEAWLRHQQLEDPDNQGLAQKLKDNDLQKALIRKELSSISQENKVYEIRRGYYNILKEQDKANKEQIDLDVDRIWQEGEAAREQAKQELEQAKQEEAAERIKAEKEKKKDEILELIPQHTVRVVGDDVTTRVEEVSPRFRTRSITDENGNTTTTYQVSAITGGVIENGNQAAVSGDTVFNYLANHYYAPDSVDLGDEDTLNAAKAYADALLANAQVGTGGAVDVDLQPAKDYADAQDVIVLDNAKKYADAQDVVVLNSAKGYSDAQDVVVLDKAKEYADLTNTTVSSGKNILVSKTENKNGGNDYSVALKDDVVIDNSLTIGDVVIDENGINTGNKKITNVAKGEVSKTSTDVVNGAQLWDLQNQIANLDLSNVNIDTSEIDRRIANNKANIAKNSQAIARLDNKIDDVDKRLSRGIASSNALAGLSQPNKAGEDMLSVGLGGYRNQQSLAIGYSAISENNKIIFKAGVATSMKDTKDLSWNTSVGFKF